MRIGGTGTHDPAAKIARQSKKCDCNFEIRANLSAKDNKWYVYKATPCHTGHNVNTSKEYAYLLDAQRMLRTASMQWLAAGHSCDFLRNDLEHFLNECHKRYQTSDHVPNNTSMNNTMSINDSNSMVSHMHSNEYLNINGSNSVAQPNVEPRVVVVGSTSTDSGAINISRKNDKKRLVSQTHLGAPENLQSVSSEQNQNQSESQDQAVYPHPGSNDFNHHSDISTMEPNKKKKT